MDAQLPSALDDLHAGDRLPWHKPQVARLRVALDTRDGEGSTADSYASTGLV